MSCSAYVSNQFSDEYEDYENNIVSVGDKKVETELMRAPEFISVAQNIEVNLGDTVRLPCLVDRLEGFVMLWKKKDEILTVASQIIDRVGKLYIINSEIFHHFPT